jgi:hypothetical protein
MPESFVFSWQRIRAACGLCTSVPVNGRKVPEVSETTEGVFPDAAQIPGRSVPEHHVDDLARLLTSWSPSGRHHGAHPEPVKQTRAQAQLTVQRIWDEAFHAGMVAAESVRSFRQRVILGGSKMKMPLIDEVTGKARWLPEACTYELGPGQLCGQPVADLETTLVDENDGKGNRSLLAQPCGHRIWLSETVDVQLQ